MDKILDFENAYPHSTPTCDIHHKSNRSGTLRSSDETKRRKLICGKHSPNDGAFSVSYFQILHSSCQTRAR